MTYNFTQKSPFPNTEKDLISFDYDVTEVDLPKNGKFS